MATDNEMGRECSYNHPVGTRCPVCRDWPYAKGGAAAFNERTAAMDALIADSADMIDAPAMVEVTDAVKVDQCDMDVEKCCGSCRLYSNNMFADQPFMDRNRCHADVAQDMPSSWKCNNYMNHRAGKDCPLWSAAQIERKPDAE